MNVRQVLVRGSLRTVIQAMMSYGQVRRLIFSQIERRLYKEAQEHKPDRCPAQVQRDKLDCLSALLAGLDRAMSKGLLSKNVMRRILHSYLGNIILNDDAVAAVKALGYDPPSFITISPTGKCNLKCSGCYAADAALHGRQLDFGTFDRIIREKREMWGSHFTVVSGGEPFLWKSDGYDLIKLAKCHPDDIFMVYTNGTLIDDELARRLADAGNISPSISVEGFEKETDERRGEGVYRKILAAFENLRNHGVPFGVSATATRTNWDIITSEKFADFYYMDQGAIYGWIFQYMPIGRGQTLDMVVPPEARVEMIHRMWRLVRERKTFMADFWNSGTASLGCISAGRGGGYFYINWDGDITPCVFAPYAADNINELYARGETIESVLDLPLFRKVRDWQAEYGYDKPAHEIKNWFCCCAIRDHFDMFADAVKSCGGRPITEEARLAIEDRDYYEGMVAYGKEVQRLTQPMWEKDYSETVGEKPLEYVEPDKRVAV